MTDLNLLPSQAKFQAAKMRLKKKIEVFMWFFSGFWILTVMVIFSVWFWKKSVMANDQKAYTKLLNNYQVMTGDVMISQQIKYQAKLVSDALNSRFEYGSSLKKIMELFSSNINIDGFEIKERQFILKGTTLGSYVTELEKKAKDINDGKMPDFSSAKLTSLTVLEDGTWKFEMEVILK